MKRIVYPLTMALAVLTCSPLTFAACIITTPPQGWAPDAARWDGDCAGTLAEGLGVLKEQQGATVKRLFFGQAHKGELAVGVIDAPEQGFIAGRFARGSVLPTEDRQTVLDAFETAAQAASAAAARFDKAGNAASASFYRGKEKALREQMD
ncbi:hypothetical protein [Pseudomonas turukhanskensis]|uniref:Lipoprotein n=1 Tax=Pseudomonas turukhanskensis TaxID=1806536 RepID=A0A9W6K4E4_9PSED|nr:hypothetical protein [Pseudomonas turukhanskensis]GLK88041.1 hypothetical protein GCM10017655_11030 [Pseudomonas turukhanskensis]